MEQHKGKRPLTREADVKVKKGVRARVDVT
jgi:hypothetical protein